MKKTKTKKSKNSVNSVSSVVKKNRKKADKKKRVSKRKNRKLTPPAVKKAALECDDFASAEVMLNIDVAGGLDALLKKKNNENLFAAWQRGRMLKNIGELAAVGVTPEEVEDKLQMEAGTFVKMLETDDEVRDLWNQRRIDTIVAIKQSLVDRAKEGRALSARQVEQLLKRELAAGHPDTSKLSTNQLADIVGKTRQTIYDWYTKHGMPRNSDETHDLRVFIAWFEKFVTDKARGKKTTDVDITDPHTKQTMLKAERIELELSERKGQLVGRDEVLAGLLARYQNLVNMCDRKGSELAMLLHGQTVEDNAKILGGFFDELRKTIIYVPEQLKLDEEAKAAFVKLLEGLATN